MKRIISLAFSLVILGGALVVHAEYLSPEQYQERSQSECSGVSGTFITNQTKDCDAALSKCRAEYLQYLHSACFSTTDYYGDEYLTCDAATLAVAKQVAKSQQILVSSACSLLKNDWPSEKDPVTVQLLPFALQPLYAGIPKPSVDLEDQAPQPSQPAPSAPETPANPEGKQGVVDADGSAASQQFSGGGCSLQIAGADSFSSSLLVIAALIAVFSSYLFLRNRKK